MASHPIVHVEFSASNSETAAKFYTELFGWKVESHPGMDYVTFAAEGGPGGGFPRADGQFVKPGDVLVYVGTDDIEASLARAGQLGGSTVVPKTEIPHVGWFAVFTDPTGNRVALFTSA